MALPLVVGAARDPASTHVVRTVPPQHVVDLIDEAQREVQVAALPALAMEAEEVADGEGVRPQVPARRLVADRPAASANSSIRCRASR